MRRSWFSWLAPFCNSGAPRVAVPFSLVALLYRRVLAGAANGVRSVAVAGGMRFRLSALNAEPAPERRPGAGSKEGWPLACGDGAAYGRRAPVQPMLPLRRPSRSRVSSRCVPRLIVEQILTFTMIPGNRALLGNGFAIDAGAGQPFPFVALIGDNARENGRAPVGNSCIIADLDPNLAHKPCERGLVRQVRIQIFQFTVCRSCVTQLATVPWGDAITVSDTYG